METKLENSGSATYACRNSTCIGLQIFQTQKQMLWSSPTHGHHRQRHAAQGWWHDPDEAKSTILLCQTLEETCDFLLWDFLGSLLAVLGLGISLWLLSVWGALAQSPLVARPTGVLLPTQLLAWQGRGGFCTHYLTSAGKGLMVRQVMP